MQEQEVTAVRAAVVVAFVTGLPVAGTGRRAARASRHPRFAVDLTAEQLVQERDCVVIGSDPRNPLAVLSASTDRRLFDLVMAGMLGGQGEQFPLLGPAQRSHRWLARRVGVALGRAGLGHVSAAEIGRLAAPDLDWLLANLDPHLHLRRRNYAYLLCGLGAALRHASLAALLLQDVTRVPEGYEILLRRSKNDPDGAGRTLVFLHDPEECQDGLCPACALRDHLEVLTRSYGRSDGPLFGSLRQGVWRPLGLQGAQQVLQQMWQTANLPEDARVGTRSLRAGAATSASEAGWQLSEIAAHLTDHRTLAVAQLYVRRYDPWSHQFHLKV
jgi:hypothetical protein